MKKIDNNNLEKIGLLILNNKENQEINDGDSGDAAELIGRSWVWSTAHFLTGGVSTLYLIAHNL